MQPPVKILHFIWSLNFGGIRQVVLNLCKEQLQNGALSVALLVGKNGNGGEKNLLTGNIKVINARFIKGNDLNISKLRSIQQLMNDYDILHIHTFNPLVAWAAMRSGKKIIYTIHGNFSFFRKRKFAEHINSLLLKWFVNRQVDLLTFNSEFTSSIAHKRFGLQHVKKQTIYNGVRVHDFNEDSKTSRLKCALPANVFIVGVVCRFVEFKKIDRLIESFGDFCKGKNTVLVLVGDGHLRPALEQQCRDLCIMDQIIFMGYKSQVTPYQNSFDICVMPSANEPFGLVAVEMLALGKPVIVFKDAGGLVEIINGVSRADVVNSKEELIKRMNLYFQHSGELHDKANERIQYAKNFDINIMEKKFFQAYSSLVNFQN